MDSNSVKSSKYDAKYDLLKFVLAVLVLAIHSVLYPMVLYPWLRISVPLFFVLSSYFVFSKLKRSPVDEHKGIIKSFVVRNLLLYLCWFIILLPITLYIRKSAYFSNDILLNIWNLIRGIIFGSTFVASWFIIALVIGFLTVYYLSKLLKYDIIVFIICLLVFCTVTLASSYTSVIDGTFLDLAIDKYVDIFGAFVCSFPAALFWVFIGKMFAEEKINIKPLWLLIVLIAVSCAGLFVEWKLVMSLDGSYDNDSYFMLAPLCVLLFMGVQRIKPVCWRKSAHFKRLSTIIYVVHGSALPVISAVIVKLLKVKIPLLSFAVTFLCCLTVYLIIWTVVQKCRCQGIKKVFKLLY